MTHIETLRRSVDQTSRVAHSIMDLAGIPDNSEISGRVEAALATLYEAVEELPKGRRASLLNQEGVLVYVIPGRDMRDWPTSERVTASHHAKLKVNNGRVASRLQNAHFIAPSDRFASQRVLTAEQYLEALQEAQITDA